MDVITFPEIYKSLGVCWFYCMALFHSQTAMSYDKGVIVNNVDSAINQQGKTIIYTIKPIFKQ